MDDKFTLIKTYILLQLLLLLHTEMIKTKYGYADTLLWILNKFEWASKSVVRLIINLRLSTLIHQLVQNMSWYFWLYDKEWVF